MYPPSRQLVLKEGNIVQCANFERRYSGIRFSPLTGETGMMANILIARLTALSGVRGR